MRVLVIFEQAFTGDPLDAVWIIDSPHNRLWNAEHVEGIDPNSAVFNPASDPLNILWSIFEHHPDWTEIVVRGVELTVHLAEGVESEAVVCEREANQFRLSRPR